MNELMIPSSSTLSTMSNAELRAELGRAIIMTAQSIAYLAACWVELEKRGEDLSDLRIGLAPFLYAVAAGRLLPEAVVSFAGRKQVLRWLTNQSLERQRQLIEDPHITVIEGRSRKRVPLETVTVAQLRNTDARNRHGKSLKSISISVSSAEYDEIVSRAQANGRSISDQVRHELRFSTRGAAD